MGEVIVGVLALQGDVREHQAILEALGAVAPEVRTRADLEVVDALVLPGGESTTLQMLLDSAQLRAPLLERLAGGMPVLGTCAGMILLAREVADGRADQEPLGAIDVAVRRNGYGRQLSSFEAGLDPVGLGGGTMAGVFIRAPLIESVGIDVEVLVVLDDHGTARPVACRQGVVTVCAFHPELSGETRLHAALIDDTRAGPRPSAPAGPIGADQRRPAPDGSARGPRR